MHVSHQRLYVMPVSAVSQDTNLSTYLTLFNDFLTSLISISVIASEKATLSTPFARLGVFHVPNYMLNRVTYD